MPSARSTWTPDRNAAAAFLAFAIVSLLAFGASRPPPPRELDADPALFSATRAGTVLARILGDEAPHPVGSRAHAAVLARLVAELHAVGLEPTVQESLVAGRSGVVTHVRNVVATLPGRNDTQRIALTAHHDSVAAGPGAADDGAGVAAVIECVRALRHGAPLEHTLVVAITDGEEVDLAGACALVREHPEAHDVRAVVNVEARGTSGLAYLFQTGPGVGDALPLFGSSAERPVTSSMAALVYEKLPNDTDLSVFLAAGWTGLNFAFVGDFRRYHTPRDDLAHLDPRSLQHLGDGALAGLRALDGIDLALPHEARPERVWHDVLGRFVLGWPRGWSVPLAVLALAVSAAAARRRRASLHGIVWGATGAALGILISVLAMWGFARAQVGLHDASDPWFAALGSWSVASLLVAFLGSTCGAMFARARGVRPADAYLGVWIGYAIAGVIVAAIEPAACLLLVAPALVAAIAVWGLGGSAGDASASTPSLRSSIVALIPFAACAAIWLPFTLGVESALGFAAGFVPGALAGGAAAGLLPIFVAGQPRRAAPFAAIAAIVAFFALARAPDRTPDSPVWTNTAHVETQDAANWAFLAYGTTLPELNAGLAVESARLLPWARWIPTAQVAPAPRHGEPQPRGSVEVLESSDGAPRIRVKLSSPRGATTFVLGFPDGAFEVAAIRSGDLAVRGQLPARSPLTFVGIGPEGVELELIRLQPGDWRFDLADVSSGLPPGLARPFAPEPTRVPRGRGDTSIVATTFAP